MPDILLEVEPLPMSLSITTLPTLSHLMASLGLSFKERGQIGKVRGKDVGIRGGERSSGTVLQPFPFAFTGNAVSQTSLVVNGVLGESITLPVKLPNREKVEAVIWHYNEIAIAIIQLNNELESPQVMVLDGKRKNRLNVTQTYSLHLSNLKMADAGSYRVQISMETPLLLSSYTLRIFSESKCGVNYV
jgi:hypothetical protein